MFPTVNTTGTDVLFHNFNFTYTAADDKVPAGSSISCERSMPPHTAGTPSASVPAIAKCIEPIVDETLSTVISGSAQNSFATRSPVMENGISKMYLPAATTRNASGDDDISAWIVAAAPAVLSTDNRSALPGPNGLSTTEDATVVLVGAPDTVQPSGAVPVDGAVTVPPVLSHGACSQTFQPIDADVDALMPWLLMLSEIDCAKGLRGGTTGDNTEAIAAPIV